MPAPKASIIRNTVIFKGLDCPALTLVEPSDVVIVELDIVWGYSSNRLVDLNAVCTPVSPSMLSASWIFQYSLRPPGAGSCEEEAGAALSIVSLLIANS